MAEKLPIFELFYLCDKNSWSILCGLILKFPIHITSKKANMLLLSQIFLNSSGPTGIKIMDDGYKTKNNKLPEKFLQNK